MDLRRRGPELVIRLAAQQRLNGIDAELITGAQTEVGHSLFSLTETLSVPVHVIPSLRREPNPLADMAACKELAAHLHEWRCDLLHMHNTKGLLLGAWAARRAGVRATVWHVHGWGFHDFQMALTRRAVVWAHRVAARRVCRIVAVSEATKEIGLRAGIARAPDYRVIREAVDLQRFGSPPLSRDRAKRRIGLDAHEPVVGTFSRLSPQKAPLDLVRAAALVVRESPQCRFVVVGDGPLRATVETHVCRLNLEGDFMFLGWRHDVPELLAACDVAAMASLWEGLPISYLEAMAMGVPVVGTDVGGTSEAIVDGETGFVVPPRDIERMADRLLRLLEDRQLRYRMGEAGRAHARGFGYDRLLREVSALYAELLSRGPP